jgi:hypothetical protein
MKIGFRILLIACLVLPFTLLFAACGIGGGADVKLESVQLGTVTMEGKTVTGLPSDNISLLLGVSARTIVVRTSPTGTILTISPSGETIEITSSGVRIRGTKPDQVRVEWNTTKPEN